MAGLREIVKEYRDEIMDGIAWVAIWKTGRSWNAKAFWLDSDTDTIADDEMEDAKAIVAEDAGAIFINEYYCAQMGDGTLQDIVTGIRFHYENRFNQLVEWITESGSDSCTEETAGRSASDQGHAVIKVVYQSNERGSVEMTAFHGFSVHGSIWNRKLRQEKHKQIRAGPDDMRLAELSPEQGTYRRIRKGKRYERKRDGTSL